jgi:CHAD domain-containing protein
MAKAKEIPGLDCEGRAAAGARLVLLARFEEMREYRAEAVGGGDEVERVHDMRVASRRLRSALRGFKPYLRRGKRLDAAREEVKRLADVLGVARDLDVSLQSLEKLRAGAPPVVAAGLAAFGAARRARRDAAREELARAATEEALDRLRLLFRRALEDEEDEGGGEGAAEKKGKKEEADAHSLREAGRRLIKDSWDDLDACAASLYRPLKSGPLHDMRIAAKRLRYALELFAACWGGELKTLAKEVAELQGALGELHDCDVWVAELGKLLSAHHEARTEDGDEKLSDERRRAALWLLGHFAGERTLHYLAALALWHDWQREGFAARLDAGLSEVASSR